MIPVWRNCLRAVKQKGPHALQTRCTSSQTIKHTIARNTHVTPSVTSRKMSNDAQGQTQASASNPSTLADPSSVIINKSAHEFDKTLFDSLLSRRFFFAPSFEIYGGCAGFFDYGPPGSALQANILEVWRKHFIIEEDMLELDTTIMTLADVLKTSGHVDK